VQVQETIRVPTRRLDAALAEAGLPAPDVLIVDVQGAEHQVLAALPRALLQHVRVIYTEVSTEAVYAGSGLLPQVEALLAWRFDNLGFAPLRPDVPMHGNVLFVARDDVPEALALTPAGRVRAAWQRWRLARRARRAVAQA
jgi:hypothetical protein